MVKNICILLIFLTGAYQFAFGQKTSNNLTVPARISKINELVNTANDLVRKHNFESSQYFYRKAFLQLDSLKLIKRNPAYKRSIDSLELSLYKHYSNFNQIIRLTDYQMDDERIFYMKKKTVPFRNDSIAQLAPLPIDTNNRRIQKYIDYYTAKSRKSTQINLNRAESYIDDIKKILKLYKIPEDLAYLIILESGVNPFANSYAYASGLWQFIESTGRIFNLKKDWWVDERKNVVKSTVAAAEMLRKLYQNYDDWFLALAAYNCGSGGLNKRIKKHKTSNYWSLFRLPTETKEYVPKFLALTKIAKNPEQFGFEVNKTTKVRYDTLQLDSCVKLKFIADMAGLSYEEVKLLNPELSRWCLPPYAKNYPVVLPLENKIALREKINNCPDSIKLAVQDYLVRKGESLKSLARELQINTEALAILNGMTANLKLKTGQIIKIVVPPVNESWFNEFNKNHLSGSDKKNYTAINRKFKIIPSLKMLENLPEEPAVIKKSKISEKKELYLVQKGDTVSEIAKKFQLSDKELLQLNKLSSNKIKVGQKLIVEKL